MLWNTQPGTVLLQGGVFIHPLPSLIGWQLLLGFTARSLQAACMWAEETKGCWELHSRLQGLRN